MFQISTVLSSNIMTHLSYILERFRLRMLIRSVRKSAWGRSWPMLCSKDLVLNSIGPLNIHHALSKVLQMVTKRSYDVIWKQFNISSQKFGITFAPFVAKHWPSINQLLLRMLCTSVVYARNKSTQHSMPWGAVKKIGVQLTSLIWYLQI